VIEGLKVWITSICTAIFFITAVEMILPDDSLKKYAKFVLGLILITVVISPIIKLFNKDFNINAYANSATSFITSNSSQKNITDYKEENLKNTLAAFKTNVQTSCESELKDKFPSCDYKISLEVQYDNTMQNIVIKSVNVGIKDNSIEKVKKVEINFNNDANDIDTVNDVISNEIVNYLSKNLNISKNIISVYNL